MDLPVDHRKPSIERTLLDYDRNVAAVCAKLDEEAFEAAWAEGRAMTPEQAIAYTLEKTVND
ncbi:MAG: hypothetical protein ACE5JP_17685 [Candidatus Bipolaricaulia bacterium]